MVALDVTTGAVLAMYSNPTFNPNGLSVHDTQVVQTTFNQINSGDKAALQRAYRDRYSPGSTFKVVTSKSAMEAGIATPDDPVFPEQDGFQIPGTDTNLGNFGGGSCGGTLTESLINSCNATFAQLGYDLGERFPPAMEQCGIDSAPPIDLAPRAEASVGPLADADQARFALAGIGQGDVFTTPLQMALIAAGIGNQRRDHAAARREGDPELRRQDGAHDRSQAVDDVHVAGDLAGAHEHDDPGRRAGHRHGRADRRRPGGGQDRHRADRRRRRGPARVVHRLRTGRTRRSTRWR